MIKKFSGQEWFSINEGDSDTGQTIQIPEHMFEALFKEFNAKFGGSIRGYEEELSNWPGQLTILNDASDPYFSLYSKDPLGHWEHGPVGHWKPTDISAVSDTGFITELGGGMTIGYQGNYNVMHTWWFAKSNI